MNEISTGEASQPTISDTTVSIVEEVAIRTEVREIMQKTVVVGRAILGANAGSQNENGIKSGVAILSALIIDLVIESTQPYGKSPLSVIPRSPVSVANTPSHVGNGESALGFSNLTHATTATSSPPKFLPHCIGSLKSLRAFFGHSMEDVHTWTSLVHHYLSFMGGSDA